MKKDAHRVLKKQGPNARHPDTIRLTDNAQVTKLAPAINAYLKEAMVYVGTGIKPPKAVYVEIELPDELPDELIEALECDSKLSDAFGRLTPGRQKSYVINLNSAKTPDTRISRITKFRDKILAAKGAMER